MSLLGRAAIGVVGTYACIAHATNERSNVEVRAKVEIKGKEIQGTFEFVQARYTLNTEITGVVSGLYPDKKHGVQIHEGSDSTVGPIYNPFGKKHGGPWSLERKVGDLGNIQADNQGVGRFLISDPYVKLSGPLSVLDKVLAVHENPDDLGLGRSEESYATGNVGAVLASGIIQPN
jgi:superoxide dismutase, Cu-Zn family